MINIKFKKNSKKSFYFLCLIIISSYLLGYKTRSFVANKIYYPIRNSMHKLVKEEVKYEKVKCPSSSLQIATFGQSNSTNTVKPKNSIEIPNNLYQFDWESGNCFKYKEPLMAVGREEGNVITYTAIKFANELKKNIIVIPFGVGGSSILSWTYGDLSYHHELVLNKIQEKNFSPNVFFWHQGETDIKSKYSLGLREITYKEALQRILDKTKDYFPDTYFGIALVSKCVNKNLWMPVRNAQQEVIRNNKKTFMSADSDSIDYRYDGCHFNAKGAKEIGERYYHAYNKFINTIF